MTNPKTERSTRAAIIIAILCLTVALGMLMPPAATARSDRRQIRNDCLLKTARQNYPNDHGIKIMCDLKTNRFDGSFYMTSKGSAHSFTDKQIRACGSPCPPPRR